jgi:hypothetical protein
VRRLIALVAAALALCMPSAFAKQGGGAGVTEGPSGDPVVFVGTPGSGAPGGPSGGHGSVTCGMFDVTGVAGAGVTLGLGGPATDPVEGRPYFIVCTNADGGVVYQQLIIYQPGTTVVDAATLARQAYRELPLLYPQPRTAPPADMSQLVGVRTWFWIEQAQWQPRSASAAVPGLSATVTATPTAVLWDTGDGTTFTCDGPGTPYDPSRPDSAQHSDCSHVYQHDGQHDVRATIIWRVHWNASNGNGGALPDVERATQFPLQAEQRQAVING